MRLATCVFWDALGTKSLGRNIVRARYPVLSCIAARAEELQISRYETLSHSVVHTH